MKLSHAIAAIALLVAHPATAETLDNNAIVTLAKIGLGEEAIVAKIQGTPTKFDVSTDALVRLSQAGVPSNVIAAMIKASAGAGVGTAATASIDSPDPSVPHAAGIYILKDWLPEPKMEMIDATTSNQTKSGGFLGYALTYGLAPMSFKTVIPNAKARIETPRNRPVFYFYFDQAQASLSNGARDGFWAVGSVTSPAEFSLVRFAVKKDRREAKVGQFSITGAKSGVMEKNQLPFGYERLSPGVFRVNVQTDLPPGEYGFIYSASTGGGVGAAGVGATTSRIFDFSVNK